MNTLSLKTRRLFARVVSALFLTSMLLMLLAALVSTANASHINESDIPLAKFHVKSTTGGVPDASSNCYTISTGDTVEFELDITNVTHPELISLLTVDGLQFQEVTSMTAIDQNNNVVPWEYNNTVPMDGKVEINTSGLPDNIYRMNVTYSCTVLTDGALNSMGVMGKALYVDNGLTNILESEETLYGLNFQIAAIDSSRNTNLNTENYLDTGAYGLYYNAAMTKPVRFMQTGNIYQVVPEWDNRGKSYINMENSGAANIQGLHAGVYYLTQIVAPTNYEEYTGVIELELAGTQNGNIVTSSLKVLNNAEMQVQPIKVAVTQNNLSVDYAGSYSVMRQIQSAIVKYSLPILGLMLVAAAGAGYYVKNKGKIAQRNVQRH